MKNENLESVFLKNEFEDDIVFARFINYMKKALLHKKIDYLRHKDYLAKKEKLITEKEWIVLSDDKTVYSFFCSNSNDIDNKKQKLNSAIEKLTEKQKIVVISYYYNKKSLKIIANELKSTVDAVEHIKQRAILRLKKYMEGNNNEE